MHEDVEEAGALRSRLDEISRKMESAIVCVFVDVGSLFRLGEEREREKERERERE